MRDTISKFAEAVNFYVDNHMKSEIWEDRSPSKIANTVFADIGTVSENLTDYLLHRDDDSKTNLANAAIEIATDAMRLWSVLNDDTKNNNNGHLATER